MITIELTDLMESLDPGRVILKIGGSDYPVRELSMGQVTKLDGFAEMSDRDGADFVATLFDGAVPPSVEAFRASLDKGDAERWGERQRLLKEVCLIVTTVQAACLEVATSRTVIAAIEKVRERVRAADEAPAE